MHKLIYAAAGALLLAFSGVFSHQSFAQTEEDQIISDTASYRATFKDIQDKQDAADAELEAARAAYRDLDQKRKDALRVAETNKSNTGTFIDNIVTIYKASDRQTLDDAQKKVEDAAAKVGAAIIKDTTNFQRFASLSAPKGMNELIEKFNTMLDHHKIDEKFSDLNHKILKTQTEINVISSHYDKTVMAVYMRDKMQSFLNSKALCTMVQNAKSGTCSPAADNALDSVFKGVPARSTASAKPASTATH